MPQKMLALGLMAAALQGSGVWAMQERSQPGGGMAPVGQASLGKPGAQSQGGTKRAAKVSIGALETGVCGGNNDGSIPNPDDIMLSDPESLGLADENKGDGGPKRGGGPNKRQQKEHQKASGGTSILNFGSSILGGQPATQSNDGGQTLIHSAGYRPTILSGVLSNPNQLGQGELHGSWSNASYEDVNQMRDLLCPSFCDPDSSILTHRGPAGGPEWTNDFNTLLNRGGCEGNEGNDSSMIFPRQDNGNLEVENGGDSMNIDGGEDSGYRNGCGNKKGKGKRLQSFSDEGVRGLLAELAIQIEVQRRGKDRMGAKDSLTSTNGELEEDCKNVQEALSPKAAEGRFEEVFGVSLTNFCKAFNVIQTKASNVHNYNPKMWVKRLLFVCLVKNKAWGQQRIGDVFGVSWGSVSKYCIKILDIDKKNKGSLSFLISGICSEGDVRGLLAELAIQIEVKRSGKDRMGAERSRSSVNGGLAEDWTTVKEALRPEAAEGRFEEVFGVSLINFCEAFNLIRHKVRGVHKYNPKLWVRKILVACLFKKQRWSQKRIGNVFGFAKATVSEDCDNIIDFVGKNKDVSGLLDLGGFSDEGVRGLLAELAIQIEVQRRGKDRMGAKDSLTSTNGEWAEDWTTVQEDLRPAAAEGRHVFFVCKKMIHNIKENKTDEDALNLLDLGGRGRRGQGGVSGELIRQTELALMPPPEPRATSFQKNPAATQAQPRQARGQIGQEPVLSPAHRTAFLACSVPPAAPLGPSVLRPTSPGPGLAQVNQGPARDEVIWLCQSVSQQPLIQLHGAFPEDRTGADGQMVLKKDAD